jgi:hypothetical protein
MHSMSMSSSIVLLSVNPTIFSVGGYHVLHGESKGPSAPACCGNRGQKSEIARQLTTALLIPSRPCAPRPSS